MLLRVGKTRLFRSHIGAVPKAGPHECSGPAQNAAYDQNPGNGNLREIGAGLLNVFEFPLLREHEELYKIENALENCGALGTSMTGSGSVMFGIFEHFDFAATASMSLMQVGYKTYLATNFDPNSDEDV